MWHTFLPMALDYSNDLQVVVMRREPQSNAPAEAGKKKTASTHGCKQCRFQTFKKKNILANVLQERNAHNIFVYTDCKQNFCLLFV